MVEKVKSIEPAPYKIRALTLNKWVPRTKIIFEKGGSLISKTIISRNNFKFRTRGEACRHSLYLANKALSI